MYYYFGWKVQTRVGFDGQSCRMEFVMGAKINKEVVVGTCVFRYPWEIRENGGKGSIHYKFACVLENL